jgi:hypothetical protein
VTLNSPSMKFSLAVLPLAALWLTPGSLHAERTVLFNRDVRPILSDNCFYCHGPDANHRKGKLRLDIREEALRKEAFVPGSPEKSALIERIETSDKDDVMPPPDSHKSLTPEQKQTLRLWIAQGAQYQLHWSYEPPTKSAPQNGAQGIDALVGQRLREIGLQPSPEADRRTLIRRLYVDLIGLPPSPEETAAFVSDTRPEAYSELVDRLLGNPHYGERMAQGWLDVVRFADTIGYHSDNPRNIYPYRDWVIQSFNSNKRFDRFTLEQVAGDLLPDASDETRIGSAFNRLILSTEEGGAQAKDYEQRMLTDRVRAIGAAWLGQTTGCAQCHDHKFDPFTTRDFYSLGAFFADIKEPIIGRREDGMLVLDAPQKTRFEEMTAKRNQLQTEFRKPRPDLDSEMKIWETDALAAADSQSLWTPTPLSAPSATKRNLTLRLDGQILRASVDAARTARNENDGTETVSVALTLPETAVTAFRIEALRDKSPAVGLGANGNFVVSELSISKTKATPVAFTNTSATFEQQGFPASAATDGITDPKNNGWAVLGGTTVDQALVVQLAQPIHEPGAKYTLTLSYQWGENHGIANLRVSTTGVQPPPIAPKTSPPSPEITTLLKIPADKRSAQQKEKLEAAFRDVSPSLITLRSQLASAEKALTDFSAAAPKCLVSATSPNPRTVRILPRGNWMDDSGEIVKAALPGYLPKNGFENRDLTRLDLARWLVDRQNPLTARTVMNRLWKQLFGTGLSKVLDDLGAQGELPPNQPLLDGLACEFMDSGWDFKHMVRSIVTSSTYRQSSIPTPAQVSADPYNRELARQSAFRLDAELVRDSALSIAGLLVPKIGGASAKPYQPEGYWENLNFPRRDYPTDSGENQYRRGLYTWWQRSFLHPSMLAFDAPSREECCAERNRSNIPQQALVLLNDPTYVEAARAFASLLLEKAPEPERLRWAWQRALQRNPSQEELAMITPVLENHRALYKQNPARAGELLGVGQAPLPKDTDPTELAAWTHVARILLNLHETITRS